MGHRGAERLWSGEALWPPRPGAGAAGVPGTRTRRLSNFLASVMWIQLSFSTTLMCFTSSLNLDGHGPVVTPDLFQGNPGPNLCATSAVTPGQPFLQHSIGADLGPSPALSLTA